MKKRKTNNITYTSEQSGYTGILYGNSSLSVYKGEHEVLHTGRRNINTEEELVKFVDEFDDFLKVLMDEENT